MTVPDQSPAPGPGKPRGKPRTTPAGPRSRFGAEVARLRVAAGLSQKGLADALGVTQSTVAQVETGRASGMSLPTIYRLSDFFNVRADYWRPFLPDESEFAHKNNKPRRPADPALPAEPAAGPASESAGPENLA